MPKWEYEVWSETWGHGEPLVHIKTELNRRGKEGWELVGMSRDESIEDRHEDEEILFVFKRPL